MPTAFPAALDTFTNPTGGPSLGAQGHSTLHGSVQDAIEAIEAKLGTGASTPAINRVLASGGTGTSVWVPGIFAEPVTTQTIEAQAATATPLIAKGHASQSAPIMEARNSAGTMLLSVGANGATTLAGLILPTSAAPAQTSEGQLVWDSATKILTVGDGTGRSRFGKLGTTVATTQAFGDAAAAGTSVEGSNVGHKHAMPADPVAASSDLTAIAALTTTAFGRSLLELATAAALQALADAVGLSPAATQTITSQAAAATPLVVKGHASQSADLFGADTSGGDRLFKVTAAGEVMEVVNAAHYIDRYAADGLAHGMVLRKSRNATKGAHTILNNGDALESVVFQGSDGTAFRSAAAIQADVDGAPGASDMPGRLKFMTSSDGSASPTERMRIDSAGRIILGAGGTGPQLVIGTGSPESVITAPVGSLFLRTDGGASTALYVKQSGAGNTGWGAK